MLQIKVLLLYFAPMQTVDLNDYTYQLPEERIARYPLAQRDASKLLVYDHGTIGHQVFGDLPGALPPHSHLVFNDTKVIPARLFFRKPSGATIEIFLLNALEPSPVTSVTMASRTSCTWQCTIGNLKRWPEGMPLILPASTELNLKAELIDRAKGTVKFSWPANETFAAILNSAGVTPLPPYLHRKAEASDRQRYQTVYSKYEGAVAAPTAGLHFTERVLQQLKERNIATDFITLHVSAGTFLPVKESNAAHHTMHHEYVVVKKDTLNNLLLPKKRVVAVGTTSMRTLESVYWYGAMLLDDPSAAFVVPQALPSYTTGEGPSSAEAIGAVIRWMEDRGMEQLQGKTSIYILPGYRFRVCEGLITNFHQPGSTLLLLIAAFIGEDWKKVYGEALENDYRFLSYGDSSLLLP